MTGWSGGVSRGLVLQQLHVGSKAGLVNLVREEAEIEPRPNPVAEHADVRGGQRPVRMRLGSVEDC